MVYIGGNEPAVCKYQMSLSIFQPAKVLHGSLTYIVPIFATSSLEVRTRKAQLLTFAEIIIVETLMLAEVHLA